jgi:hypothetical protein
MIGRVITVATVLAALTFTTSAFAARSAAVARPAAVSRPAACPAGVPTQTLTVVDQAHVESPVLARLKRAVAAQSMQLRAAWGTPCVAFGPGGWRVYLKIGIEAHGVHLWHGVPYAIVWTGVGTVESWSRDFSHEIIEMLVDPETNRSVFAGGVGRMVEVADPVEWYGYRLDGIYVSDFVLPAWFAGATTGEPTCFGDSCSYPGPPLASADAAGPYDEMHLLTAPWQGPTSDSGS